MTISSVGPTSTPDRIGVTGCSGGGAIATYVGVFEPRVKAVASGCFINSFRTLFTGPTADSEMSLPAFLASGLDMADFFEVAAPLPWLMMATTEDYFPPDGGRAVYAESRRWYGLYGAADRIQFFVGKGPHGTPRDSREQIYRWMIRWVAGDNNTDPRDQPVKLYTNLELQVTKSGNVDNEPGSRKLYQIIAEEFRSGQRKRGVPELLAELRRLGIPSAGPLPSVTTTSRVDNGDFRVEEVRFESEQGVTVTARLYLPKREGRKSAVVMFEEKRLPVPLYVQRSQSTAALAEALARAGQIVMELDPRDEHAANEGRPFLEIGSQMSVQISLGVISRRCGPTIYWSRLTCLPPGRTSTLPEFALTREASKAFGCCWRPPLTSALAGSGSIARHEYRHRARRSAYQPSVRRNDPALRPSLGSARPCYRDRGRPACCGPIRRTG